MRVEHHPVEAHLLDVQLLVQEAVVQIGLQVRVDDAVAQRQVEDRQRALIPLSAAVLIRPLSEIPQEHTRRSSYSDSELPVDTTNSAINCASASGSSSS